MKVFITGGTGFIGSHVIERLAQDGHELRCLVRKTSDVRLLQEVGATLITGDVTDKASMLEGMRGAIGSSTWPLSMKLGCLTDKSTRM